MLEHDLGRAITAHRQGNLSEAEELYRGVLEETPTEPTALHMLGVILLNTDRPQDALELLGRAAFVNPKSAEVLYDLGMASKAIKDFDAALSYLGDALHMDPNLHAAEFQIGHIHKDARNFAEAEASFQRFIAHLPKQPHGYLELGNVYREMGNLEAALVEYETATRVSPTASIAFQNYGVTLADLGQFDRAIAQLGMAIQLDADNTQAWHMRALAIRDRDDSEAGLRAVDAVIAHKPDDVWTHISKAELLFEVGRFPEAWREYEWRTKSMSIASLRGRRFGTSAWDGTSLANRHVLLRPEQGIGEQVLFAGMVPDLMSEAASVAIECEKRLLTLFARSFPKATVIDLKSTPDWHYTAPKPEIDVVIGSLGARFRENLDQFPSHQGYLKPDPRAVKSLRNRYLQVASGRPIVGVSWRSFSQHSAWRKSAALPVWSEMLSRDDIFFVDIQYGDVAQEREEGKRLGLNLYLDSTVNPSSDIDRATAQIAALDAVMSTSNSCVHLAGALNIPAVLMMPARIDRHWYWFPDRTPNPWYSSVKVVQQHWPTKWTECLVEAEKALDQILSCKT